MRKYLLLFFLIIGFESSAIPREDLWTPEFYKSKCSLSQYTRQNYSSNERITVPAGFVYAGKGFEISESQRSVGIKKETHVIQVGAFFMNTDDYSSPNYPLDLTLFGHKLERHELEGSQLFYLIGGKTEEIMKKLKSLKQFKVTFIPHSGEEFEVIFNNVDYELARKMYLACVNTVT